MSYQPGPGVPPPPPSPSTPMTIHLSRALLPLFYFTSRPVVVRGEVNAQAGERRDDRGNWTGGNWLHTDPTASSFTNTPVCTLGFSWRRWGVSGTYGGIARHCVDFDRSWFHNTRAVGSGSWSGSSPLRSTTYDSALLLPAAGTAFSPTVWVGPIATNVERTVISAANSFAVGDEVALSGARTGLTPAFVSDPYVLTASYGPVVRMDRNICQPGDSGGPWLTTYSSGDVMAWGQHHGDILIDDRRFCAFVPVLWTSQDMSASILTP